MAVTLLNVVVLVDHDCHMVSETRRQERQEKNRKRGNPVKSHRHIQLQAVVT
jgi:hypothetical protein